MNAPNAAPPDVRVNGHRPTMQSISPLDGRLLAEYPVTPTDDLPDLMGRAREAQGRWGALPLARRIEAMRAIQDSFYRNLDAVIESLIYETGKPRFEALVEIFPSIELLAYQRRIAAHVLGGEDRFVPFVPNRRHRVEYRPFGVVAVIAPWNFPVILSTAPIFAALLTGNAVIFKPSEFASQMGAIIGRIVHEAGIDPDLMQVVQGYGDLGAALVRAQPDKICFTGSIPTGRKVAALAGELLIPVTLELGGKDAAIVLSDADLERTAVGLVWGGMHNAGQACLSVERIYVERPIAEALIDRMKHIIETELKPTTPDQERNFGAITTDAQLKIIEGQVREAVEAGARLICGGGRRTVGTGEGRFYEPTLLTDVTPDMRVLRDETFGPVIVIIPVEDAEEAIRLTNDTRFGLTASVWTRDRARGLALARRLRCGNVAVNDHIVSASTPQLPWGGVGDSGYGRERGSEGLLDMVYPQAISVDRIALPRELYWYPYTAPKKTLLMRAMKLLYGDTARERLRALLP